MLVHGNEFNMEVTQNNTDIKDQIVGKAKIVYDHLSKMGKIKIGKINDTSYFELNEKCIHFFIEETLTFTKTFALFIGKKMNYDYLNYLEGLGIFNNKYNLLLTNFENIDEAQ